VKSLRSVVPIDKVDDGKKIFMKFCCLHDGDKIMGPTGTKQIKDIILKKIFELKF
jgi:hypothetical protein